MSQYGEIVSGIIKEPRTGDEYKVFIYEDKTEKILRSKIVNRSETNESFQDQELHLTDQQAIEAVLNWNDDEHFDDNIKYLLDTINNSCTRRDISEEPN